MRFALRPNQLGRRMGLSDVAKHILCMQLVTVIVNQHQVIAAGGETSILDTVTTLQMTDQI
jgi:hypothetical protein